MQPQVPLVTLRKLQAMQPQVLPKLLVTLPRLREMPLPKLRNPTRNRVGDLRYTTVELSFSTHLHVSLICRQCPVVGLDGSHLPVANVKIFRRYSQFNHSLRRDSVHTVSVLKQLHVKVDALSGSQSQVD